MKKIRIRGLARKLNRLVLASVAGVTMAGATARAQIVVNGFFNNATNDSSFSGYAGYAGMEGDPEITGWTQNGPLTAGLNGYDIHFNRPPEEYEKQFAPPGYSASATETGPTLGNPTAPYDPVDFAFIQNAGTTLTQTLAGLDPLSTYTVTFLGGTRSGDPNAVGSVSVTGGVLPASADIAGSDFTPYSFTFATGLSSSGLVLTLDNTTPSTVPLGAGGDNAVDFADIVITDNGPTLTPEPGTYALLGVGALGLLLASQRRVRRA